MGGLPTKPEMLTCTAARNDTTWQEIASLQDAHLHCGRHAVHAQVSQSLPKNKGGSSQRHVALDQPQLLCSFDSRPASIDVKLVIDALGMCADGAQADHEFTGDLGSRKLGLEQPENFQLTLAERLDQGL